MRGVGAGVLFLLLCCCVSNCLLIAVCVFKRKQSEPFLYTYHPLSATLHISFYHQQTFACVIEKTFTIQLLPLRKEKTVPFERKQVCIRWYVLLYGLLVIHMLLWMCSIHVLESQNVCMQCKAT